METPLQLFTFKGDLILTERKMKLSKLSPNKKHESEYPQNKSERSHEAFEFTDQLLVEPKQIRLGLGLGLVLTQ